MATDFADLECEKPAQTLEALLELCRHIDRDEVLILKPRVPFVGEVPAHRRHKTRRHASVSRGGGHLLSDKPFERTCPPDERLRPLHRHRGAWREHGHAHFPYHASTSQTASRRAVRRMSDRRGR